MDFYLQAIAVQRRQGEQQPMDRHYIFDFRVMDFVSRSTGSE